MNGRAIIAICTTIEVIGICGLAAIGLKRNEDAYKAEIKCINAESEMFKAKIDCVYKDAEIKFLKEEIAKLKRGENNEEEA